MFRATIVRVDSSTLLVDAEIKAQNAKRGLRDGHVWRGMFSMRSEAAWTWARVR
jgi:hypothetical protein